MEVPFRQIAPMIAIYPPSGNAFEKEAARFESMRSIRWREAAAGPGV
jgi:hypothetical protein